MLFECSSKVLRSITPPTSHPLGGGSLGDSQAGLGGNAPVKSCLRMRPTPLSSDPL